MSPEAKPASAGISSLAGKAEVILADRSVRMKWQHGEAGEAVMGNDGMIYCAGKESFKSIDSNGIVTVEKPLGARIYSPILATEQGKIIISDRSGSLYALDSNGKECWRNFTEANFRNIESKSEARDGTIYLMDNEHTLLSIDPSTGHVNWKFKHRSNYPHGTVSEIYSIPKEGPDGTIYLGSHDKNIYAISPDGKKKWEFRTKEWVNSTAAFSPDGTTVYMGGMDGIFRALDTSGNLKWQSPKLGAIEGEAAIGTDGTVYFGSHDKCFYAYGPDGSEKWKFQTGKHLQCSPFISRQGNIYVGGNDGYLYAFNSGGGLLWKFDAKSPVNRIAGMGPDNTLYILTDDKRLIAVDTDTKSIAQQIEEAEQTQSDDKPEIVTSDEWLIIGGVKLPVDKRAGSSGA